MQNDNSLNQLKNEIWPECMELLAAIDRELTSTDLRRTLK